MEYTYACSNCRAVTNREKLTVKKVIFAKIGAGGRIRKSRTLAWLCFDCLKTDADWNIERFDAPGLKARVKNG